MESLFDESLLALFVLNMGLDITLMTGILLYSCSFFILMYKNAWEKLESIYLLNELVS